MQPIPPWKIEDLQARKAGGMGWEGYLGLLVEEYFEI